MVWHLTGWEQGVREPGGCIRVAGVALHPLTRIAGKRAALRVSRAC